MRVSLTKKYYQFLLILCGIIPIIPNYGNFQMYNAIRGVIAMFFFLVCLHGLSMKLTGTIKTIGNILLGVVIYCFCVMMLHSVIQLYPDFPFTLRDWLELSKPFYNYVLYIGWIFIIYKNYKLGTNVLHYLIYLIAFVSFYNLLILWSLRFESIPFMHAWNPYYTVDGDINYPRYVRGFGLTGASGNTSNYTGIMTCAILALSNEVKTKNQFLKLIVILAVVANIVASLQTYSRIGLIFNILSILFYATRTKVRIIQYSFLIPIGFIAISAYLLNNGEFYSMDRLNRGGGLEKGSSLSQNSSVSSRLYSRGTTTQAILQRPITALIGYGPNKNLLSSSKNLRTGNERVDNSGQIWATDTDYSIIIMRWGFVGLILFLLPYFLLFKLAYENRKGDELSKFMMFFIISLMLLVQADPPITDLRCPHAVYMLIGYYVVYLSCIKNQNVNKLS